MAAYPGQRDDGINPHGLAARAYNAAPLEPKEQVSPVDSRDDAYGVTARPSFGQWIKLHWLDILTLVSCEQKSSACIYTD